MNKKIIKAIDRLNSLLPLEENQRRLPAELQILHREILYSYIDIGRTLNKDEIMQRISDLDAGFYDDAIKLLQKKDMVVFDDEGEPIGAYPFTMEKREHKIGVNGHVVCSMCALDSLAVSTMYGVEVEIDSVCRISGDRILIRQNGFNVVNAFEVQSVYFAINWNAASSSSCCANSLCTEMIFIRGESIAKNWFSEDEEHRQIFALEDAVEFAAGFFTPLVEEKQT